MKKHIALLTTLITLIQVVTAQDIIRQRPCDISTIKSQVDSIKVEFKKTGYTLMREASIAMESEYEMPVIVPLNDGSWYHIVFIGDKTSKLLELRMFDWQEKQVIYQKSKNDNIVDGNGNNSNILDYIYAPKFSEYHMIKPVQINKKQKKDLTGYIMLFKRTS